MVVMRLQVRINDREADSIAVVQPPPTKRVLFSEFLT